MFLTSPSPGIAAVGGATEAASAPGGSGKIFDAICID